MDFYDAIVVQEVPEVEGRSAQFNDLIKKCLEKDRSKRPKIEQLLNHPFFKGVESLK